MANFQYRAVDASGAIVRGFLEAPNEQALESRLRQSDAELLRCSIRKSGRFDRRRRVSRRDLIGFCFHMEQVSRAGLPMLEALTDLRDSVTHPGFRQALASLVHSVEGGKKLSQAMEDHPSTFDNVFVSLVAVGEETGELAEVMGKLTESLKWQDELVAQAKYCHLPGIRWRCRFVCCHVHDDLCRSPDGRFHPGNGPGVANAHTGIDRAIQFPGG